MTEDRGRLRHLAELAIRQYKAEGDPYRIQHTVQVTSFGGSGTTALCNHLLRAGVDLQPGPAQWPFKHRRRPPAAGDVPEGFRVVYLVGDPRNAVLSLFRRGIQVGHFEALHERSPDPAMAQRLRDIDTFLAGDDDPYELADHVRGWLEHPAGYPVLVVRQDRLASEWREIATFVGVPHERPSIPSRVRTSDWRNESRWVKTRLNHLYGDLAAEIDAMPPLRLI